jgi:hypothetical protein
VGIFLWWVIINNNTFWGDFCCTFKVLIVLWIYRCRKFTDFSTFGELPDELQPVWISIAASANNKSLSFDGLLGTCLQCSNVAVLRSSTDVTASIYSLRYWKNYGECIDRILGHWSQGTRWTLFPNGNWSPVDIGSRWTLVPGGRWSLVDIALKAILYGLFLKCF